MRHWFFVAGIAALASQPVQAEFFGEAGDWEIYSSDGSCGAVTDFEGPGETLVVLLKRTDGSVVLEVTNLAWTAREGEKYEVAYSLNGFRYSGSAIGTKNGVRSGFASSFGPDFAEDFAKGSSLHVYLGDQRIDQLSLDGTAAAVAAIERCLTKVRATVAAAEKERQRYAHLPKDPFATPAGAAAVADLPRDAVPTGAASWAARIAANYPSKAIREGRSGRVAYTATIGANGKVTACNVTETSGHTDLDEAACAGVIRYARFNPALNDEGQPIEDVWTGAINYSLGDSASESEAGEIE